jgi:DNA-directed RNA polymerase subunit RPC12/RpoP
MAGMDYIKCKECGNRLFYDGDGIAEERIKEAGSTENLTCSNCVSKLKKQIVKLKKHDRRRH